MQIIWKRRTDGNLLEVSNGADLRVALGERGRFQDAALADGADADVPLSLAQRLVASSCCGRHFLPNGQRGRRTAAAGRQLIGVVIGFYPRTARFRAADLPRGAKLFDTAGQLAVFHAEVVSPTAVEVAAEAAESPLERRRHRHFQEALAVPKQFHSCLIAQSKSIVTLFPPLVSKMQKNLNATLTEIGSDDDAVALLDDGEDAQADEGQRDAFVVHFDFHVLSQRHFQVFNLRKKRARFWMLK